MLPIVKYFIQDYILHFYEKDRVQYSINQIFHFIEAHVLYLFHVFSGEKKACEHINNQTVHI